MPIPSQPLPTVGQPSSTEDPKVRSALSELQTILTAGVDSTNMAASAGLTAEMLVAALAEDLGLTNGGTVRRGTFTQTAEGTTTSTSYTALSNGPDRVANISLPSDSLLAIAYTANIKCTAGQFLHAAIHIGSDVLRVQTNTALVSDEVAYAPAGSDYDVMFTYPDAPETGTTTNRGGLHVIDTDGDGYTDNFSVPQIIRPVYVFAPAGTHTVEVKYKVTGANTLTAKNRKLWVWTMGF